MKKVLLNFYILGLIVVLIIAGGMFFEFSINVETVNKEVQKNTLLKRDYIESEIRANLSAEAQVINVLTEYVTQEPNNDQLYIYLAALLARSEVYSSLYFGTPENKMINASGWIPPPSFDLRTRPWYIKAVAAGELVFSEAFVNASNEDLIVTISRPVYSREGQLLGVVSGDISVSKIFAIVRERKIGEEGYSFIIDSKGYILAHPDYEYDFQSELPNISSQGFDFADKATGNEGIIEILLEGELGFLAYKNIAGTDWRIASFIPYNEYNSLDRRLLSGFTFSLISLIIVFGGLFFILKRNLITPILSLAKDVRNISLEEEKKYRLPIRKDLFIEVRSALNEVLQKTDKYFTEMQENYEELAISNDNLEETLQKLSLSEVKNRAIITAIPDVIFLIDEEGIILDYHANEEKELYLEKEMFLNKNLRDIFPAEISKRALEKIQRAIAENDVQSLEYSLEMPYGLQYYEARIVKNQSDNVIAIIRNVTLQRDNLERIAYLSYHDQLTGLYNRRFYEEEMYRLDTERNLPFSIIMLDVNGLKLTNDVFGHKIGDELLIRTANIMKQECRTEDIIARLGGDEFAILLPGTTSEKAAEISERIYRAAQQEKMEEAVVSIAAGWATKTAKEKNIHDTLIEAEEKMYARKIIETQEMRKATVELIRQRIEEDCFDEEEHRLGVAKYTEEICVQMGLPEELTQRAVMAAKFHDLGKITIARELLQKVEKLEPGEYEEIKKHSEKSYLILKSVDEYADLAGFVLYHHERWDGKGYPQGLTGERIPLISRIIAVADAWEAMLSERSYRKALSEEEALKELRESSGAQFDPEIVAVFIEKVLKEKYLQKSENN